MTQTTPQPDTPLRTRTPIWVRVLLFLSLAINLAVLSIVGGAIFGRDDRPALISRELGLGPYLHALESDRREALNADARGRKSEMRGNRSKWRQAYEDSLEALRADPFEQSKFRDAVAMQAQLATRGRDIGLDVLLVQVSDMSADERQAFADELERRMKFFARRAERSGGKDGPPPKGERRAPPPAAPTD